MVDELWWTSRLDEWAETGLEISGMAVLLGDNPDSASELLLEFEELITINRKLVSRITNCELKSLDAQAWLSELKNPLETRAIEGEWLAWADANCPWEPVALTNEEKWHSEGKFAVLAGLIDRLSALDVSSHPSVYPLVGLIADPENTDTLSALIGDIELDEIRRRKIIVEMIEMLGEYGVDATEAIEMPIMDALGLLDSLQAQAENNQKTKLLISREISPFDPELADSLLEGRGEDVEEKALAIADNFNNRLDSLNALYAKWSSQGVMLPFDSIVSAEELLDHEAGLPEMDDLVNIHLDLINRWNIFDRFWPDLCDGGSDFIGFLEKTEELADFVEGLEQEWRSLELDAGELIETLSQNGFIIDRWRTRIKQDPRSGIRWLRDELALYDQATTLIEELRMLDVSLEDDGSIDTRIAYLKEIEIDSETISEMADFIERKSRRNARHRIMLEREWRSLKSLRMVSDQNTASLNLARFEKLIESATTGRDSSLSTERLLGKMQDEIDAWGRSGFDVEELQTLLDTSPSELAQKIIPIRDDVARHSMIRKRLSLLPWSRSPSLAVEVNLDLSKPQNLATLDINIPLLAKRLLASSNVDDDFEFIPWKPSSSNRPILVPVSSTTNSHEDAMEAILDEMERLDAPVLDVEPIAVIIPKETPPPSLITVLPPEIIVDEVEVETENIEVEEIPVVEPPELEDFETETIEVEEIPVASFPELEDFEGQLLEVLGIDGAEIADLVKVIASAVGHEPRDTRVDRLLRLALRVINPDISESQRNQLLGELTEIAKSLSEWTGLRLSARNQGNGNGLLADSAELGKVLSRIPGPGLSVPLTRDNLALPPTEDIVGLGDAVRNLANVSRLPVAGGIR
jgi:hypothetical protein